MRRLLTLLLVLATAALLSGQQPPPPYPQPAQTPPGQTAIDQPGRAVARISLMGGEASVRRGDSGDWVAAAVNAPLMAGDSVSVAPNGSAELQLDYGNFLRIGGDSEIRIAQLDNGRYQIQVSKGLLTWRMLRDSNVPNVLAEISTPEIAVHPQRQSSVRVEVASDGGTRVIVRHGEAEVSTPRGSERVGEGNMMLARGTAQNPEYQIVYASPRDGWDSWNDQRDSYLLQSQSDRYVSPDITGAEDLDPYGRWGYDPAYGNVWTPNVPATWAPYQNGQWVWEDFYGWTWVPYDPWGWAPFHYGSWYFRTGYGWTWFPGQRYGRYWWHPAMVGFFGFGAGGFGVGIGFGNVGWVALAPFEVFHPWYGPGVFGAARFGAMDVDLVNYYRNARIANGVMGVSAVDFQRGVFRPFAVNRAQLMQASLVRGAVPLSPTVSNLRFSSRTVSAASIPRGGFAANERFFSRMPAASPGRTPFAQQQAAFGRGDPRYGGAAPAARNYGQPGAASGWSRFGEPSQPARGYQAGGGNSASGWGRFGAPQRSAPPQGRYGAGSYGGYGRALQVSPPMVQQRLSQQRLSQQRAAPNANRGGGGRGGSRGGRR